MHSMCVEIRGQLCEVSSLFPRSVVPGIKLESRGLSDAILLPQVLASSVIFTETMHITRTPHLQMHQIIVVIFILGCHLTI